MFSPEPESGLPCAMPSRERPGRLAKSHNGHRQSHCFISLPKDPRKCSRTFH